MVPFILFFAGTLFGFLLSAPASPEYYATKYDHLDIEKILNNRRMVTFYTACMLSKGPCSPEGLEIKRILPEAIKTNCQRCTEKQKTTILNSIHRLKKEYPKEWGELQRQWDPQNTDVKNFEENVNVIHDESLPEATVQIINKFEGGPEDNSIRLSPARPTSFSRALSTARNVPVPSISISTTSVPFVTKNTKSNFKIVTTTTSARPIITTRSSIPQFTTTNKPLFNTLNTPIGQRPASFSSTQTRINLNGDIVEEFVKGLSDLGSRVLETGSQIVDTVIKSISK